MRSLPALTLPGTLSCAGGTHRVERPEVGRADGFNRQFSLIFAVFSPYFRAKSVDKSYRKAIINYLRESKTKIGQNRPKSAKIGGGRVLLEVTTCCLHDGQDKDIRAHLAHLGDSGYFSL